MSKALGSRPCWQVYPHGRRRMLHHQQGGWLRQITQGTSSHRQWEVCNCMALGLPAPPSARLAGGVKCLCGSGYDTVGHHAMTCSSHAKSAWNKGHKSVLKLWADLARRAGVSTEKRQRQLHCPVHTFFDQRADIKLMMAGWTATGVVGDVSQTHAFVGKGKDAEEWGRPYPRRIKERVGEKNCTYGPFYRDPRTWSLCRSSGTRVGTSASRQWRCSTSWSTRQRRWPSQHANRRSWRGGATPRPSASCCGSTPT
eukprot:1611021-Rhodomonas_salina.5